MTTKRVKDDCMITSTDDLHKLIVESRKVYVEIVCRENPAIVYRIAYIPDTGRYIVMRKKVDDESVDEPVKSMSEQGLKRSPIGKAIKNKTMFLIE